MNNQQTAQTGAPKPPKVMKESKNKIRVEFESSYEETGPFGAKSIGEIVINTPSPAISNAIQNATGVIIRELPMTAEKIYRGISGR